MRWLRALFRKDLLDQQLDKEVRFHIERQVEDNLAAGMSPEQARREALIAFGGVEQIKEQCRDVQSVQWIESVLQDLRFGLRTLRKRRGYTFAAILALALGIGVNTALFTLFNSLALRPLPVPDPSRVAAVYRTTKGFPYGPFSFPDYVHYREHNTVFTDVSANFASGLRLNGTLLPAANQLSGPTSVVGFSGPQQLQGSTEQIIGLFVSANYFSVMGVNPVLGRAFFPEEDRSTGPPYAVLVSENFWQRRFGRDPNILGQNLTLSGIPATVVGITPRYFMGERPQVPDVWLPLAARQDPQHSLQDRNTLCCMIEARLKPGITLQQAQAEMSTLTSALHREYPDTDQQAGVNVTPAVKFGPNHRNVQALYIILQPAIGLVLLIACANVAGLLLGRAASRQKEIAIRLALGASRRRLMRQLLTEGVLIAQLAGGVSLLATWWALNILVKVMSTLLTSSGLSDGGTIFIDVTPDARVFLYTSGIALGTGVAFALAPALQATKPDLIPALKEEGDAFGARGKSRLLGWIVATQIAVCLMLLIGAGMLVRSSVRLLSIDPGFETRTVLNVSILNPRELGYSASYTEELHRLLQERLRALPGVKSIAVASRAPLGGGVTNTTVNPMGDQIAGDPRTSAQAPQFPFTLVSPEYFGTLGISLPRGRSFTPQEVTDQAPLVIVSDALARRLWPGEDAIGKRVTVGSPRQTHFGSEQAPFSASSEVIGVARDVYSVSTLAPDPGALYLPQPTGPWDRNLFVRIEGDPRRVSAALVSEIQALDRRLSVSFQTLDAMMTSEGYFVITRLGSIVFAVIGALGLILASVGVYSMVGYRVSQQTREVGIRVALGAQKSDVLRLLLGRCVRPIASGITVGIVLGILLSHIFSALFPGLRLLDPIVILAISLLLIAVAMVAAYIPARKATKLNPASTLRFE